MHTDSSIKGTHLSRNVYFLSSVYVVNGEQVLREIAKTATNLWNTKSRYVRKTCNRS